MLFSNTFHYLASSVFRRFSTSNSRQFPFFRFHIQATTTPTHLFFTCFQQPSRDRAESHCELAHVGSGTDLRSFSYLWDIAVFCRAGICTWDLITPGFNCVCAALRHLFFGINHQKFWTLLLQFHLDLILTHLLVAIQSEAIMSDSDDPSDLWEVISPTNRSLEMGASSKAAPLALPSTLHQPCAPRMRAPFQVTTQPITAQLQSPARHLPVSIGVHTNPVPTPQFARQQASSLSHQCHRIHNFESAGLPAPGFQRSAPSSFSPPSSAVDASVSPSLQSTSIGLSTSDAVRGKHVHPSFGPANAEPHVSRVKLAATSSVVLQIWTSFATAFTPFSLTLQQMSASMNHLEHRNRFLNQFAATTLIRYMTASLQVFRLCQALQLNLDSLSAWHLADVLIAGSMARRSDGSGPKTSIAIKAMRWCYKQLQISIFQEVGNQIISSFDKQKFPTDRRESLPLPLYVVMRWERRILQSNATTQEIIILGGLLLLLWSGLRFGDIQRSCLETWQLDSAALRGLTWRSKTSNSATPFGICVCGLLSKGTLAWIHRYLQTLDTIYSQLHSREIDFAIPSFGGTNSVLWPPQAMAYGEALYFLRYYMTLPWSSASATQKLSSDHYTIHGLKCTLLSWACQLGLSEEDRRQHGKHKPAQQSVALYSRDDVVGSLRLQQNLIDRICQGWRPCTPLARGGQQPIKEPSFQMERFRKETGVLSWKFFQFDRLPTFATGEGLAIQDQGETSQVPDSDDSTTSQSSVSSSSSDAEQVSTNPQTKKCKVQTSALRLDQYAFGLHRVTWHIMLPCSDPNESAPQWDGQVWKTACGRFLPSGNIVICSEMSVRDNQVLCSHVGCRKSFTSIDH